MNFIIRKCLFQHHPPFKGIGTAFDMRFMLLRTGLDRSGATAIEYAMIALLISIAAFSVLLSIGSDVSGLFTQIANSF